MYTAGRSKTPDFASHLNPKVSDAGLAFLGGLPGVQPRVALNIRDGSTLLIYRLRLIGYKTCVLNSR